MTKDEQKAKKTAQEAKAAQTAAEKAAREAKKATTAAENAKNAAEKKAEAAKVADEASKNAQDTLAKAAPADKPKATRAAKQARNRASKAHDALKKAQKDEATMAKAAKKAEDVAAKAAAKAADKATKAAGKVQSAGPVGGRINLTFYNAATLARVSPSAQELANATIELQQGDGLNLDPVPLQHEVGKDGKTTITYIVAPPWIAPQPNPNVPPNGVGKIELPCDVPRGLAPALVIKQFAEPLNYNCCPYQMQEIVTDYPGSAQGGCSPVNIGLVELEESYSFKLLAYDSCIGDYISNPKALIDNVRFEMREVETSKVSGQGSAFQGRTFSAITERGYAVVSGLEFGRVYEPRILAPKGYFCTNPPPARISFCSGQNHGWPAAFQPCGQFPSRSIIFVQQSCPGVRVASLDVRTGQGDWTTDPNGICNLSPTTTGTITFQSVGRVFSPPSIELTEDSPLVFVVGVAEGTATQLSRSPRAADRDDMFVLAFEKAPPVDTEVAVRRLNGEHVAYLRPNEEGEYTYPAQPDDIFDFVVLRSGRVIDSARLKA